MTTSQGDSKINKFNRWFSWSNPIWMKKSETNKSNGSLLVLRTFHCHTKLPHLHFQSRSGLSSRSTFVSSFIFVLLHSPTYCFGSWEHHAQHFRENSFQWKEHHSSRCSRLKGPFSDFRIQLPRSSHFIFMFRTFNWKFELFLGRESNEAKSFSSKGFSPGIHPFVPISINVDQISLSW